MSKVAVINNNVVGINLTVLSHIEYDNVRKSYGIISKEYVIPKDPTTTCDEFWIFKIKRTNKRSKNIKNHKNKRVADTI